MHQFLEFIQRKAQTAGKRPQPADLNTSRSEKLSWKTMLNTDGGPESLQFTQNRENPTNRTTGDDLIHVVLAERTVSDV